MINQSKPLIEEAYKFSVAPMLDCTDRHFRVLMRQISRKALLYTEMIVAKALLHNNRKKLLDFDEIEHPISLQIGGDDAKVLSEAAQLAEVWGYDEINLNLGCPSPKVKAGNFGACLMEYPDNVARCIEAIKKTTNLQKIIKNHEKNIKNHQQIIKNHKTVVNKKYKKIKHQQKSMFTSSLVPNGRQKRNQRKKLIENHPFPTSYSLKN